MADDDWRESTEGDLDPDLTEEAGYAGWDAPPRRRWSGAFRFVLAVMLLSFAGGALAALLR
jgi:hypothetical protein